MRVLWIEGSPRGANSRSSAVARAFLEALAPRVAGAPHDHLNVWDEALPAFDQAAVEARYAVLFEGASASEEASWAEVRAVFDRVFAADIIVLSTPMWNFGLPYRLKQLIDLITQPDLAFRRDGALVTGLFADKRAVVVTTSALAYAGALASMDHQARYLESWLDFIGLTRRHLLQAAPMYGPPAEVDAAHTAACREAAALAETF